MRELSEFSRRALVVFASDTEIKWLRFLKRGYRHCFAVIEGRSGWAVYNPLSHYTEIEVYPTLTCEEIARFYQDLGYEVVKTRVFEPSKKVAPIAPFTCVEAVKRALGVQARTVTTPWQLKKYLDKNHNVGNLSLTIDANSGYPLF